MCVCISFFASQFECVWTQMPANERNKLQYSEFLKGFGVPGRTPHVEAGGTINNVPSSSPETRETDSATKSGCPEITVATLQRTKVQHLRINLCHLSKLYLRYL